jgi:hypothetical protein
MVRAKRKKIDPISDLFVSRRSVIFAHYDLSNRDSERSEFASVVSSRANLIIYTVPFSPTSSLVSSTLAVSLEWTETTSVSL